MAQLPLVPLAVITGASGGIGAATVRRLSADGFDVLLLARSGTALEKIARAEGGESNRRIPLVCDVTRSEDVDRVAAKIENLTSGPVVLVNNAGTMGAIGSFGDVDFNAWSQAVDINLSGAARITQACLPFLTARPGSAVVNISSGACYKPMKGWSAYCTSKAGLAMFTQMLHLEYGDRFPTYGFQPGLVDTDMQMRIRASGTNEISAIPQSDLLPPDDPATIISWLGQDLPTDLAGMEFRADDRSIRLRAGLKG